jgi:drug/metabolite transporter (DMT)-like permease
MTEYTRRLRRSILLWQVLGAFGLSFIYLGIAMVLSRSLSEDWQRVRMWAFMLSLAGALAAGTYVTWKQRRVAKHKPVEKPE